jgi:hypothetical protein
MNLSLHRLNQAIQATLLSLAGHDPADTLPEDANPNAEAGDSHELPDARPPSEPREGRASDAPLLQPQTGLVEPLQSDIADNLSEQIEPEPQSQLSDSEPPLSHGSAVLPATAEATTATTTDATATAPATITTTPANPIGSRDPSPPARSETPDDLELDWSEEREHEITRLESENAHLRALLGIDPDGLATAGIPDIDPEPPLITSSFHGAPHPSAAGSSAWANSGAETANPFTFGFREDPSVLGLAATPSRLHTLTPPNAPHAIMTATASTSVTPSTASGTLTGRAAGVFVSASWGAPPTGNDGNGAGIGMGPGPVGPPQLQQPRSSPPPLGIASLARTMELQVPATGGPASGPGGAGRGRGLFGGRGRSVAW